MSKNLFITATGTDVGKTYVTGLIVKKLHDSGKKAAYYKAAMSGNLRGKDGTLIPGDASYVKSVSNIAQPLQEMCPYVYEVAVSPHLASQIEGNPVTMSIVRQGFDSVCSEYDYVTVEGSGGIICPLRYEGEVINLEDVIKEFDIGCLIIADAGLGTINAVVLTVEYMRSKNIAIEGIIFNHFCPKNILHEDNLKMCEAMTGIKVIACVQDGDTELDISADLLEAIYR